VSWTSYDYSIYMYSLWTSWVHLCSIYYIKEKIRGMKNHLATLTNYLLIHWNWFTNWK